MIQKLWDKKIETHILIGNHDIYFKNTNSVNALQQLCTAPDGINEPWIYEEPKVVNFDGLDILMLPWINPENQQQSFEIHESRRTSSNFKQYQRHSMIINESQGNAMNIHHHHRISTNILEHSTNIEIQTNQN